MLQLGAKRGTVNSIIYPYTPTFHYSSLVPTYSDRGCLIEIPRLRSLYIINLPRINFKYRNIFPAFLVRSQIRKSIPLPGPSLRTLPKSAHHRPCSLLSLDCSSINPLSTPYAPEARPSTIEQSLFYRPN
jgi:hypothetical protein